MGERRRVSRGLRSVVFDLLALVDPSVLVEASRRWSKVRFTLPEVLRDEVGVLGTGVPFLVSQELGHCE